MPRLVVVGGAVGAAIGNELGRWDGSIIGGAIGRGVGAAVTTPAENDEPPSKLHEPASHQKGPGGHPHCRLCPPGRAKKERG